MVEIVTLTLNPALDVSTTTRTVEPTAKLRCGPPRHDPGGGGINIARVIHSLGGDVLAIFPSGGVTGSQVERLVAATGTPFAALPIAGQTRESFTVAEESSGTQFRFVLPGPLLSEAEQQVCLDRLASVAPGPCILVVSGSMPPGVGPGFLARIRAVAADWDARLILDLPGETLRQAGPCDAFLIKPNVDELASLVGRALPTERDEECAAARLVADGYARVVAASLGPRGVLIASADGILRIPAPDVPLRSAVGAGDSMVAAMAFALCRDWPLEEAARFGVAAGSAALATAGTGLAEPPLIEELFAAMPRPASIAAVMCDEA